MSKIPVSISELEPHQIPLLIAELEKLDKNVSKKVSYVISQGFSEQDALEYVVNNNPYLWAKVYLDWEARHYQKNILLQGKKAKKLVLRLGRRLGKTECMCILILWHAFTQINKGPNPNMYDILIVTPFETQIDLIFDRLHKLIDGSPMLQNEVTRDVYHRIEFKNDTKIAGLTAGSKSGTGAANTRGQRADLLIFDESDYMGSPEITNILNIRNEAPDRIKVMAASTPSGKHEEFYKWCTNASRRYFPPKEDIDNFRFIDYIEETNSNGNGWVEVYAPSTVNEELLKINSDTEQTYLEDLKDELTEMRFAQEVMAEFGEEEFGVYQKKFIETAVARGKEYGHKYTTDMTDAELKDFLATPRNGARILGVDWDKYGASTNMACLELDKFCRDAAGNITPMFKVLFRVEIPRGDFTYTDAVNRIIELNDQYDFDWIAVDRGYGRLQIENFIISLYNIIINKEKSDNYEQYSRVA